jgi:Fe-S cluster assembly protein SufD
MIKAYDQTEIKQFYLSKFKDFENRQNGRKETPFAKIRRTAINRFEDLGFPGKKVEEWKYTDISPILRHQFSLEKQSPEVSKGQIGQFRFKGLTANVLVFVNGIFKGDLSALVSKQKGITITNLSKVLYNGNEIIKKYLSGVVDFENEPFAALNTAFAGDGAFLHIPDNVILEEPVHILNIAGPGETEHQSFPRNLVVIGRNSHAKIIETHHHLAENVYFHNSVTEFVALEGSHTTHFKIQDDSKMAYRIDSTHIHQETGSVFTTLGIDLGGSIVRNNLTFSIDGENCEANLYGFMLISGKQHVDNHTIIDHLKPNCNSNELFKGILGDKARGVFSGTIHVRKDAQKTNAFQSNKNLLLSDEAEVDSKPQLKIFADDVKCSHGATIGQLDEESLFYLRQRGIPEADAHAMLQYAFAADIFNKIDIEPVRKKVDGMVQERLLNV